MYYLRISRDEYSEISPLIFTNGYYNSSIRVKGVPDFVLVGEYDDMLAVAVLLDENKEIKRYHGGAF
jgi:hypothetical protein